jgi:branched-subunit amino acid aminotransferase/4-amino-4-deoxychorismate lyase
VTAEDLQLLAFGNYGHYTSMQVRRGCVRGLDLHLERLDLDAVELFGASPQLGRLREALHHARAGVDSCSVRITLFSRDLPAVVRGGPVEPDVMVIVTNPSDPDLTPLRVSGVPYEREMPKVKHLATYGLLRSVRTARTRGFDDALLVDRADRFSEGSTWNLCLHDGDRWVWPVAAALDGITMQLLKQAMRDNGVAVVEAPIPIDSAGDFRGAFATNSLSSARPLSAIDATRYAPEPRLQSELRDLYESVPWDQV